MANFQAELCVTLMRFIDLNWDINIHKYSRGLMRFIAQFCLGLSPMKGLGHTHKYSTSFTHSFQPRAELPMFQQKVNNEVHESQHTLTIPLDS